MGRIKATDLHYKKYLIDTLGSSGECGYFLILSKNLRFLKEQYYNDLQLKVEEIKIC